MFSRRAADVISEAYLTAMTGDHHDELAALDLSMAVMISVSFNSYVNLAIFFIIPVLFCFVFEHETIYTTRVVAVFDFYYRT